jgi:mycofactocin system FadH/OYE family oxidoreductase 1
MRLLEPLDVGGVTLANRVMFGPHVTNLGDDDRRFTARHTAYYARRATGGAGIIVTEGASVHSSDWPYERSPLAERCGSGWTAIVEACHPHGAKVIASLDHAGGQGSSAYHQAPLWAPSRMPEVNTREVPKWMEPVDIAAVVAGFAAAAGQAMAAGCDGVEINAGQHSLVRQFLSGLTNQRGDTWGTDRLLFARQVIEAVRGSITAPSGRGILGLRLSCDELAPWAGITPEMAPQLAASLVALGVDYLVVTRGAIYSAEKTRPDFHEPTGFNIGVCREVKSAVGRVPVFLQGSVVEWGQAEWAISDGVCDGVEMTRAQLADPDLVSKVRTGQAIRIRTCTRCNQTCQVRDARNPIVTCAVEPTTGRETEDPDWYTPTRSPADVVVVGGGVAGLETARVAAARGHRVRLVERSAVFGGVAAVAGPAASFVEWLVAECRTAGVEMHTDTAFTAVDHLSGPVVQATGSRPGQRHYAIADDAHVIDIVDVRSGDVALPAAGMIALFDPIGGPIAVELAAELGERAILITQDQIAGNELSRSGDLAPANVRLAQRGVHIERRALLRSVTAHHVVLEDRFSGEQRSVECVALVDCGFRLPDHAISIAAAQVGDCVAPRTVHEAVLEARRAALAI